MRQWRRCGDSLIQALISDAREACLVGAPGPATRGPVCGAQCIGRSASGRGASRKTASEGPSMKACQ